MHNVLLMVSELSIPTLVQVTYFNEISAQGCLGFTNINKVSTFTWGHRSYLSTIQIPTKGQNIKTGTKFIKSKPMKTLTCYFCLICMEASHGCGFTEKSDLGQQECLVNQGLNVL